MRALLISMFMMLMMTGTAFAGAEDACLKCHKTDGNRSLAGAGTDNLVTQMKSIRDGAIKHPPALDGLSDADLEAIAAALDAG